MTTTISISQTTNLTKNKVYTGIPIELTIPDYPTLVISNVYLFDADNGNMIFTYENNLFLNNVTMLLYNNFRGINYSRSYVFSTSPAITPKITTPGIPPTPPIFGIPNSGSPGTPAKVTLPFNTVPGASLSRIIQFTDYYTSLTFVNSINLNAFVNVPVGWSNPNISDYGNDDVRISTVRDNGNSTRIGTFTNNQTIRNDQFVNLPSGTYYLYYDFGNDTINHTEGSDSITKTNTFSFITERLQSVSATGGANSTPVILTINIGYGYTSYKYTITITDTNNVSSSPPRSAFPFRFTSPSPSTMTYNVLVSNSQDANDTNTATTTFISYQNVIFSIANKIKQSLQNYLTWTGGISQESFQYGTTPLYTISNSNIFTSGNPLDARSLTVGTGYLIQPVEDKENSKNYGNFYFDSIESTNQTVTLTGTNGPFLSTSPSTLTWNAYYKFGNIAPDGNRKYAVTIGGYTGESINNTLSITGSNVNYGIPYTIRVVDIVIATNYKFYEKPYQVTINPGYINYPNRITWISSTNPQLNIGIGTFEIKTASPTEVNLIESKVNINTVTSINFWPDLLPVNPVSCLTTTLSANTFTFWNGGTVPYYQPVTFSIQIGSYIYNTDTFLLKLYRKDGTFVQNLEINITKTTPFTFIFTPSNYGPFSFFQADDVLRLQADGHVNYGLSGPFTFYTSSASVTLDGTDYNIFSTITATLNIEAAKPPSFRVYLHSKSGKFTDLLLTTLTKKIYLFQPSYTIPSVNMYLNKNVSLLYKLDNYPDETIESPPFRLFQNATVTVDQDNYTTISTIISTLNIPNVSPSSFTVQLIDGTTPYEVTNNMKQSTFLFKPYITGNVKYLDKNVYLQFILNGSPSIIIDSSMFVISSTYFTLNKSLQLVPEFARATSNVICVTQKKNNVPTTNISIKNNVAILGTLKDLPHFAVPCGIITYLDELNALLKTMTIRAALLFLIQKYSIPIPSSALISKKRYQYPTADANVQYPILQYNTTFRLGEDTLGYPINTNPALVEKLYDARILSIANNDTKTLSSYYTDILVNATYWLNTLPPLVKDGSYFYCVARPINGTSKQIITASVTLIGNQLIFTPLLLRTALLFYVPYPEGDIAILYSSARITDVITYVQAKYYETFLDDTAL